MIEAENSKREQLAAIPLRSWRSRIPALLRISGLVLGIGLLAGCDEGEKHKVLTFFFDGVPPLHGQASVTTSSDLRGKSFAVATPAQNWHVHEPVKDCTQCHGRQLRRGTSTKAQLVADPPQLCYQCHSRFTTLEGWVHGPVAAGDCLLCHEPHRTRNEFLLDKPVPELCYQCHEAQAIHTIERHDEPSYAHCIDCHDGHSSTTRALLRPDAAAAEGTERQETETAPVPPAGGSEEPKPEQEPQTPAPRGPEPDAGPPGGPRQDLLAMQGPGQDAPAAPAQDPQARAAQEKAAAELYYRSLKQYHAGQLPESREGFLEALHTGLLPDPMRETAQGYLQKIDEALQESRGLQRRSEVVGEGRWCRADSCPGTPCPGGDALSRCLSKSAPGDSRKTPKRLCC
jgi:predicted CXXCH cytochrome family protein